MNTLQQKDAKQLQIKSEIEQAVSAIIVKHGLNHQATQWQSKNPWSTVYIRPDVDAKKERAIRVDVKVIDW